MIRELPQRVERAIRRDKGQPIDKQSKRNNVLTIRRMQSWLYERGLDMKTSLPIGRRPNKKRQVA